MVSKEPWRVTYQDEYTHLENSNGGRIYVKDVSIRSLATALSDLYKRHVVIFEVEDHKNTHYITYKCVGFGYMTSDDLIKYFQYRGLKATLKNHQNKHIQVKGAARTVNYYGRRCSIYCEAENGLKPYRLKGADEERALERVVGLANQGY